MNESDIKGLKSKIDNILDPIYTSLYGDFDESDWTPEWQEYKNVHQNIEESLLKLFDQQVKQALLEKFKLIRCTDPCEAILVDNIMLEDYVLRLEGKNIINAPSKLERK